MAHIKMRLDGKDMMVPEEDCVWTEKDGELYHIYTLGEGFSLFEFEGLDGTFEERLQQVKDNRSAGQRRNNMLLRNKETGEIITKPMTTIENAIEDFPTITDDTDESENNLEKMPIVKSDDPEPDNLEKMPIVDSGEKPKKKTTSDWLFDN